MLLFTAVFRDGEKREFYFEGKKVVERRERVHIFDSSMEAKQWWLDTKAALRRRGCTITHAGVAPVEEKKEVKGSSPREKNVRVFGTKMSLNDKGEK